MRRLACVAALVVLGGCGEDLNNTSILICGDLDSAEFDTIRVISMDTRMRMDFSAVVADEEDLPIGTEVPRREGSGFIGVEARREGLFVARAVRRVGDRNAVDFLEMELTTDCLLIDCPADQTCVAGDCERAPLPGDPPYCE